MFNMQFKLFYDYFLKFNLLNNIRNFWFSEYWEKYFNCIFRNIRWLIYFCKDLFYLLFIDVRVDVKVLFVIDVVFLLVYVLYNLYKNVCGGFLGFCFQMKNFD